MEHYSRYIQSKALHCFPEVVFLFDFPPNSRCGVRIRTRWGLGWVELALKQIQRRVSPDTQVRSSSKGILERPKELSWGTRGTLYHLPKRYCTLSASVLTTNHKSLRKSCWTFMAPNKVQGQGTGETWNWLFLWRGWKKRGQEWVGKEHHKS